MVVESFYYKIKVQVKKKWKKAKKVNGVKKSFIKIKVYYKGPEQQQE